MKKKRLYDRIGSVILALAMILSLVLSPAGSNVAKADEGSSLSIVSTQNNLTYAKGDTIDLYKYFTVNYNGAEPYCVYDGKTGSYHISTVYTGYKLFYELFDVRYVKVEDGTETELTDVPSDVGTYKAYASFPGTEYYLYETYDDLYTTGNYVGFFEEEMAKVEDGVIEFEIGEAREIDESKVGSLELVYGDSELADEDAFILLMFGDGFTSDQQDDFYKSAKENAEYIMNTSPWDEFSDVVKIYALGTISADSGATGENAKSLAEVADDTHDTYFKSSFWSYGLQRLLAIDSYGQNRINDLKTRYLKAADYSVLIVNSSTYGGSGGEYCVASLNTSSLEMMLHELGHTVAGLGDEYWTAPGSESYANMTADPENVKWSKFIGKNGIGVYEYDNGGDGWYRPSQTCKMRFLGKQYAFCEVCKEELRKAFCSGSNVTKLFFQPYAKTFYEDSGEDFDMSQYFILRKGDKEVTGEALKGKLQLTYYKGDQKLEGAPTERGDYKVVATFAGDDDFGACSITADYTIEPPNLITLQIKSKTYDGKPAEYTCDVDYDKPYYTEVHFTGSIPYSSEDIELYDDAAAPTKPGNYEILITAYDEATKELISRKRQSFDIEFKQTALVDNNSLDYPGASVEYNNRTIAIVGEGFTADEQDKFEELAQKYVKYIQNTEPFKETQLYFNFTTVETESDQSGIGREPGDTYFKLYYDENGKIVTNSAGDEAATYLGYNIVTAYYSGTIVIVNDDKIKEGASTGRTIYGGIDEDSMAYVSRELLNYLTNEKVGYVAETDEEITVQRDKLLESLGQYWYYEDYAVITSRAYDEKFVENGSPIKLDDYFHTYLSGQEVPNSELNYEITYYDSNKKKLSGAPSKAGTYYALCELNPPEDGYYLESIANDGTVRKMREDESTVDIDGWTYVYDNDGYTGWLLYYPATEVTLDGKMRLIPRARGWTSFTIQAAGGSGNTGDPGTSGGSGSAGNTDKNTTVKTSASKTAKTGDTAPMALYLILLAGAVVAGGTVIVKRRRR